MPNFRRLLYYSVIVIVAQDAVGGAFALFNAFERKVKINLVCKVREKMRKERQKPVRTSKFLNFIFIIIITYVCTLVCQVPTAD